MGEAVQRVSSEKLNHLEIVLPEFPQISLEGIAGGRRSSADDLVSRFGPMVWAMAKNCSDCEASAEEITIEIFGCLFRNASKFDRLAGSEKDFVRSAAARCIFRRAFAKTRIRHPQRREVNTDRTE
jgi:hypothetical protein